MRDDVGDLGLVETEVDRHEHAAVGADPEEGNEETSRVGAQDRDPRAVLDARVVEPGRKGGGAGLHLRVRHGAERARPGRLVDDGEAVRHRERGAVEEVPDAAARPSRHTSCTRLADPTEAPRPLPALNGLDARGDAWEDRRRAIRHLRGGRDRWRARGRLAEHGNEVVLIARGEHLAAIRARGLVVESPEACVTLDVEAVGAPDELTFRPDDVVVLAMKSQDTVAALDALVAVAPRTVAVVCAQNGVDNERAALRRFELVYGMCVMCPATHLEPGVVQATRHR